jgi:hypothetical protein
MKLTFDKNLATVLIFIILLVLGGLCLKKPNNKTIEVTTDQQQYNNGGSLKLRIRNLLAANVCFSSCYPYYLERKESKNNSADWDAYSYQSCLYNDQIKECIDPGNTKAFEISLPKIKQGVHRLSLPACKGCAEGQTFQENERFYSNEFEGR